MLGDVAYASAYDRGRSMPVEEVVSLVLGETTVSASAPELVGGSSAPESSRREVEVAELIARGLSNKEISETLTISPRTAEGHVARLLDKLGLHLPRPRRGMGRRTAGAGHHAVARRSITWRAAVTRHLPVELTTFVGRRKELAEGRRMVRAARVVTIVGPGGVGKTRLAVPGWPTR